MPTTRSKRRNGSTFDDAPQTAPPVASQRRNKENSGLPVRQPLPSSSRPPTAFPPPSTTPSTPRNHKKAGGKRTDGIKHLKYGVERVKTTVKEELKLDFDIDDWQAFLIHKVLEGYDSVCIAGTGYGKSILFEGISAMSKNKVVIVVCPLKVLEKDQVKQAGAKGIKAIYVNGDNCKDPQIWRDIAQGKYAIVYVSPEMLLSARFLNLLLNPRFRAMLVAIIIDEAHLIAEWGDDFRVKYKEIHRVRTHTGRDIPFLAVTATATTGTFEIIWTSLEYGCRPFWGIDVGCERPNLQYMCRPLADAGSPILEILNLFPKVLDEKTQLKDIPSILLFQKTREECCEIIREIRRVLPPHLRDAVHAFYSSLSEKAKDLRWDQFCRGGNRLMAATTAASVGCNKRDLEWVVNVGLTESLSGLSQRFGRAGRDASMKAKCAVLVPPWSIRPPPDGVNPALARVKGKGRQKQQESKRDATRRGKLDPDLEEFINLTTSGYEQQESCAHAFMRYKFRPDTGLDAYHSLDASHPVKRGPRSMKMPFVSKWIVLTLKHRPDKSECCSGKECNPALLNSIPPADVNDPRLRKYEKDFLSLKINRGRNTGTDDIARPSSAQSNASDVSNTSTTLKFKRGKGTTAEQKSRLATLLVDMRERLCSKGYGRHVVPEMLLPDALIKTLMTKSYVFLRTENRTRAVISQLVDWDMARDEHYAALVDVLNVWSSEIQSPPNTPSKAQQKKKTKVNGPGLELVPKPRRFDTPAARILALSSSTNESVITSSASTTRQDRRHGPYPLPTEHPEIKNSARDDPFASFTPTYRQRAVVASVSDVARQRLSTSSTVQAPTKLLPSSRMSNIPPAVYQTYQNASPQSVFPHTPIQAAAAPYPLTPIPHFNEHSPPSDAPIQTHRQPAFNPQAVRPPSNLRYSNLAGSSFHNTFSAPPQFLQSPQALPSPFRVPPSPGPFMPSPLPAPFQVPPTPNASVYQQPVRLQWMTPNSVGRSRQTSEGYWHN